MFDIDSWREIFQSIQKNKLRAILSGFTVAFAILLFTLLFGIVNGLQNYFKKEFVDKSNNSINVNIGLTTIPYKGLQAGRMILFRNKDVDFLIKKFKSKIQYYSSRIEMNAQVDFKTNSGQYEIQAVHPDYQNLKKIQIDQGRFINQLDLNKSYKVLVLGRIIKEELFGQRPALNRYVNVNGVSYKVIGVFSDDGGKGQERIIYMPITTAQKIYGNTDLINDLVVGYNTDLSIDEAISFGKTFEKKLKEILNVHPKDQALNIDNSAEGNKDVKGMTGALFAIVLVIGLGTLIAGIIGISNIMIFSIKERTKELGIRKALGAKPSVIVGMVVKESLVITGISGYVGLLLGTFILRQIAPSLKKYYILNPSVSPELIFGATVTLIIAGLLAGYFPARRASRIKPIVALRAD